MNSEQIKSAVYTYACNRKDFTAPYGVLEGEHTNSKGTKFKYVTFGRARTLDATVEIYNRNFIILRVNLFGNEIFKDAESLFKRLDVV